MSLPQCILRLLTFVVAAKSFTPWVSTLSNICRGSLQALCKWQGKSGCQALCSCTDHKKSDTMMSARQSETQAKCMSEFPADCRAGTRYWNQLAAQPLCLNTPMMRPHMVKPCRIYLSLWGVTFSFRLCTFCPICSPKPGPLVFMNCSGSLPAGCIYTFSLMEVAVVIVDEYDFYIYTLTFALQCAKLLTENELLL